MSYREVYDEWITNLHFDEKTRQELEAIAGNESEIEERFYQELEFGTGGMRGILGAGINRINRYTILRATQGLANIIREEKGTEKGVVIAYDSRNLSAELAMEAAKCLAANGIKTYLFSSLRPTPLLSFAVRELACIAGIVITASHNPARYNGYKVYWEDGAQITAPRDKQITAAICAITDYTSPLSMSKIEAIELGRLIMIDKEVDNQYFKELKKAVIGKEMIRHHGGDIRIVYTPLHGAGAEPVKRILQELGFSDVHVVAEQMRPDGNFPTVDSPNPEEKKAFVKAIALAKKVDADIVLATDPDADRVGIYAKETKGVYVPFTGNMSAAILLEYVLTQKKKRKILPTNGAVVTTIVSGNMGKRIAKEYGLTVFETLTGFKYIGQMMNRFEDTKEYTFQFGYEESYGCLLGTYARDKDAVMAVAALCEAALFYKIKGATLPAQMENLYQKYGYYYESLGTVTLAGKAGNEKIRQVIEGVRNQPPKNISGRGVTVFKDYEKENVLFFILEDEAWCCIRPSGTEPKIKFYAGMKERNDEKARVQGEELLSTVMKWIK